MDLNRKETRDFEDFNINVKIKLALLWVTVTLCYLYGDYFELYIPGKVAGLASGKNLLDSPQKLFGASVLLAIPAIMVFLSVALRPKLNRWVNIIIGIFFTVIMILIAFTSVTPWRVFYVFLAIVESTVTILIVWYACKWPRKN